MVACLCGNRTVGGQIPPPRGFTTLMGLVGRLPKEGINAGEAAYASGAVLYEDKGRLSVREAGREPESNE